MLQCECFAFPLTNGLHPGASECIKWCVIYILAFPLCMSFLRLVCSAELFLCFISKFPQFYGFLVEMSDWMTVVFTPGEMWWGLWFLTSSSHRPRLSSATVLRCPTLLGGNYQVKKMKISTRWDSAETVWANGDRMAGEWGCTWELLGAHSSLLPHFHKAWKHRDG